MNIIWGPESTQIYNDGYRTVCGQAHPQALGENYSITWASAWPAIGDSFERAWAGERMFLENQRMFLKRLDGKLEETFFTFSHSPIQDESGRVGGLLHPVTETTLTMLAERRTRALRDLAASLATASDEADVARLTVGVLARFEFDLPFVLFYAFDPGAAHYRLAAHHGIAPQAPPTPSSVARDDTAPWPFAAALASSGIVEIGDLQPVLRELPCGPYEEPPQRGFVIPIVVPAAEQAPAVIVTAASSRLPLNADYRSFYDLLSVTIAGALSAVRAREDERRRAAALAEIDRAKTAFFSNVSHEFRTPLTLMLGPLEDTLARSTALAPADRDQLETVHRNSLRLLKLVNTLLDFSRIEAGRVQAVYEPLDLASATAELASVFRAAVEKAGLELIVDCRPLAEPAYVDREMWEKIVLNLISNAFKFTFEGRIEVGLRESAGHVELTVRDTGTGIPAHELPKLFERFHRVAGAHGRTHEGSGIGLALVQELVKLHGGSVGVDSDLGRGSMFTVTIPRGCGHLPAGQIGAARTQASTALGATPFVEEALRWLPDPGSGEQQSLREIEVVAPRDERAGPRARIVLADDNRDMRDYVRRLLASRYDVEAVADGEAALAAIARSKPDLVLTDIMMPRLDGMQLIARLRADETTSTLPVIALSARAGEESRVEGMQAGADDYLIKPFSARELLARVESHLRIAHYRSEATESLRASEERYRQLADLLPVAMYTCDAAGTITYHNKQAVQLWGRAPQIGDTDERFCGSQQMVLPNGQVLPHDQCPMAVALRDGSSFREEAVDIRRPDGSQISVRVNIDPIKDEAGRIVGAINVFHDVTELRRAEEASALLVAELNHRVKNTLASVQAIAQQTLRRSRDPEEFVSSFAGRIQSLARVHSLLSAATWRSADLRELVRDQLLHGTIDETRVTAAGPALQLEPQMALRMAMMLHELGTNAVKYGALSGSRGWVTVSWTVEGRVLRLRWEERGGPPGRVPTKRGFGTVLIEQSAATEGGSARMIVEADGISWEIAIPLGQMTSADGSGRGEAQFVDGEPPRHKQAARTLPGMLAGKHFLIVEDEPLVALDLAAGLSGAGAEVAASVGSSKEALAVIGKKQFDAALLDANLNGQPVDEIAAALTRSNVPFLFVSGYGRDSLPRAFREVALIGKPFSQVDLLDAAARLLEPGTDFIPLRKR